MTNTDILNYLRLRDSIQELINKYVQAGIPATMQLAIFDQAISALNDHSHKEIEQAVAEENARQDAGAEAENEPAKENLNYQHSPSLFDGD